VRRSVRGVRPVSSAASNVGSSTPRCNETPESLAARTLRWLRGFALWRFSRFDGEWAVNATRWFYISNHAYRGERRYYVRIGKRPGWTRSFGKVVV
jgi:hypothetical protein